MPLKENDVEGRTYWKGKLKETDIEKRDLPVPRWVPRPYLAPT